MNLGFELSLGVPGARDSTREFRWMARKKQSKHKPRAASPPNRPPARKSRGKASATPRTSNRAPSAPPSTGPNEARPATGDTGAQDGGPKGIALALSGGGFRATLFHLGVIRYLRDAGLLSKVNYVVCVSGGSIIAADLVLRWKEYTGACHEFDRAADRIVRLVRMDVSGRIIRRWFLDRLLLVPWLLGKVGVLRRRLGLRPPTSTMLQQYLNKVVFQGSCLNDLKTARERAKAPELEILATSLNTGGLCWFNGKGFWWKEMKESEGEPIQVHADTLSIAFAVTASAAFPILFGPVRWPEVIAKRRGPNRTFDHQLSDGGVIDNLGIQRLRDRFNPAKPNSIRTSSRADEDTIILSDAQAAFDWKIDERFSDPLTRVARASEMLMWRVTELEKDSLLNLCKPRDDTGPSVIHFKISNVEPEGTTVPPEFQAALARVRTNLNRFNSLEIDQLIRHGYAVARAEWKRYIK